MPCAPWRGRGDVRQGEPHQRAVVAIHQRGERGFIAGTQGGDQVKRFTGCRWAILQAVLRRDVWFVVYYRGEYVDPSIPGPLGDCEQSYRGSAGSAGAPRQRRVAIAEAAVSARAVAISANDDLVMLPPVNVQSSAGCLSSLRRSTPGASDGRPCVQSVAGAIHYTPSRRSHRVARRRYLTGGRGRPRGTVGCVATTREVRVR